MSDSLLRQWLGVFGVYYDFESHYKSIWLTGFLLIVWSYDPAGGAIDHFSVGFYQSGQYE